MPTGRGKKRNRKGNLRGREDDGEETQMGSAVMRAVDLDNRSDLFARTMHVSFLVVGSVNPLFLFVFLYTCIYTYIHKNDPVHIHTNIAQQGVVEQSFVSPSRYCSDSNLECNVARILRPFAVKTMPE